MGKVHLKSLFEGVFKKSEQICIQKSNPSFSYFLAEYPNEYNQLDGNFIVRSEIQAIQEKKEKLRRFRSSLARKIMIGTNEFLYFSDEYRQNAMMRDHLGNIVLDDETIHSTKRR